MTAGKRQKRYMRKRGGADMLKDRREKVKAKKTI